MSSVEKFYLEYISDFYKFAETFLKIETKSGKLVPYIPRTYQRRIIDPILEAYKNNKSVRLVVCKGRQLGISTTVASVFFWLLTMNHHMKCKLIADQTKRADEVFGIYQRFLSHLHPDLKPMVATNNDREIYYQNPKKENIEIDPGLDSGIKVETAKDENAGRAGTAQIAHLTEHAYFDYAAKIDEGLGNSVPLMHDIFSVIVKESTSNGLDGKGGAFYSAWCDAESGDSNAIPIFISWTENEEYEWPTTAFTPTDYEKELMKKHPSLTHDKLMWRRMKIKEYSKEGRDMEGNFYTPEERFRQDYPLSAEESFLSSGNPIFDQEKLKIQIDRLTNRPVKKFNILSFFKDTLLEEHASGLEIYDVPIKETVYAIGADIAEGLEHGDSSHAFVVDKRFNQVARWHGKIDPDLFGILLVALGKLYNDALLAPEINNMGYATLTSLKNANYWNIYERETKDQRTDEIKKQLGWRTTGANKLDMISYFQARHRDGEVNIRDVYLLREMRSITRDMKGNVDIGGKDRVAAACIALQAVKQATLGQYEQQSGEKKGWYV